MVALETTLLAHGVPKAEAIPLLRDMEGIVRAGGANPALIGIVAGVPTVGMTEEELASMLASGSIEKANTSNLGVLIHRGAHAATTVSATMEIAAAAGIRLFATGGLGGVHKGYGERLDISADLAALARLPVAVIASGVKSLLDVVSTRELLETLGVPVVGFGTDRFPAFYLRDGGVTVDARFDDERDLADYLRWELMRAGRGGRGVLVANPIPVDHELPRAEWEGWLKSALLEAEAGGAIGRDATPFVLARLHDISRGATLRANLALVKANAGLAGRIAAAL